MRPGSTKTAAFILDAGMSLVLRKSGKHKFHGVLSRAMI
jgi:hypothetical protein